MTGDPLYLPSLPSLTEQDNLTSDDVDEYVIVNEENVTTSVTHGSHMHDGDDTHRQKKVTFDPYLVAGNTTGTTILRNSGRYSSADFADLHKDSPKRQGHQKQHVT
jgi:hypothetical protein